MKKTKVLTFGWITLLMLLITSCNEDLLEDIEVDNFNDNTEQVDPWDNDGHSCLDCGNEGTLSSYKVNGNQISLTKDFDVSQQYLKFQQDKSKHQELWQLVTTLIPSNYRKNITKFEVFHGEGDLLGYVSNLTEDLKTWVFGLDIYSAYSSDDIFNYNGDIAYTTIHEYGHILSLNYDQLDPNTSPRSCNNYHTGEGCSRNNSYMKGYFEKYWKDINHERKGQALYNKYPDRFVTEYGATNPGEDIAESFTFFVIKDKPTGNKIADEKVRYFYNFPELVQLRNHMRNQGVQFPIGDLARVSRKAHAKKMMPKKK